MVRVTYTYRDRETGDFLFDEFPEADVVDFHEDGWLYLEEGPLSDDEDADIHTVGAVKASEVLAVEINPMED